MRGTKEKIEGVVAHGVATTKEKKTMDNLNLTNHMFVNDYADIRSEGNISNDVVKVEVKSESPFSKEAKESKVVVEARVNWKADTEEKDEEGFENVFEVEVSQRAIVKKEVSKLVKAFEHEVLLEGE